MILKFARDRLLLVLIITNSVFTSATCCLATVRLLDIRLESAAEVLGGGEAAIYELFRRAHRCRDSNYALLGASGLILAATCASARIPSTPLRL